MKRILSLLLCALLVLGLFAGCKEDPGPYVPTGDALDDGSGIQNTKPVTSTDQQLSLVCYFDRSLNPYTATDLTNRTLLPLMYQERDVEALCLRLQEVVENFMSAMFYSKDKGNHYIRKALRYMSEHYGEHLELTDVAAYVQLSPSYFSTLFRQVVGQSFREQLCQIRVEESKQLLLSTDYSLTDIAIAVGFPDQSYYCKVFKRIVGLTPGKFRD